MPSSLKSLLQYFQSKKLTWNIIKVSLWSFIGKGLGFIVPFIIAAWFGVSNKTDAFFFVYGLIIFFSGFLGPVIEATIIPFISDLHQKKEDIGDFLSRLLGVTGIVVSFFCILCIVTAKPILAIITKFTPEDLKLIQLLFVESAPLILLLIWTSILTGVLNASKVFIVPALAPGIRAVINILVIYFLKNSIGIHAVAIGYVIGELVRLLVLFFSIRRLHSFNFKLSLKLNPNLILFIKTCSFQIVSLVVIGFNPVIDRVLASWLGTGGVSVLEYANRIYTIPLTLVTTGLLVVILSHWSEDYSKYGIHVLEENLKRVLPKLFWALVIAVIFMIILTKPGVNLIYGRPSFSTDRLNQISHILFFYIFSFLPYVIGQVYVRVIIILKETKILIKAAICRTILGFILNYLLMFKFGVATFAITTFGLNILMCFYFHSSYNNIRLIDKHKSCVA